MSSTARRIDTLQTIELAEGMEIHLRVAGPFLRFVAFLLDLLIQFAILWVVVFLIFFLLPVFGDRVGDGFRMLASFFITWFYHVIFEVGSKGSTWGKRAFGLRVVNDSGGSVTVGQSMVRNFLRMIEILTPFVPLIAFFNARFQRLGDFAANTLVVYARPRIDPIIPGPPPMDRVPVNLKLTREEEAAILAFRYRSGGWSDARRMELVGHLAKLTGETGPRGVAKVLGMANWLEDGR